MHDREPPARSERLLRDAQHERSLAPLVLVAVEGAQHPADGLGLGSGRRPTQRAVPRARLTRPRRISSVVTTSAIPANSQPSQLGW